MNKQFQIEVSVSKKWRPYLCTVVCNIMLSGTKSAAKDYYHICNGLWTLMSLRWIRCILAEGAGLTANKVQCHFRSKWWNLLDKRWLRALSESVFGSYFTAWFICLVKCTVLLIRRKGNCTQCSLLRSICTHGLQVVVSVSAHIKISIALQALTEVLISYRLFQHSWLNLTFLSDSIASWVS